MHLAGTNARGHAARVPEVARLHTAAQAIHRVVGEGDRLLLVAVRLNRQHRAEDLFARDRHGAAYAGEDGRADIEAAVEALRTAEATGHELGALGYSGLDHRLD